PSAELLPREPVAVHYSESNKSTALPQKNRHWDSDAFTKLQLPQTGAAEPGLEMARPCLPTVIPRNPARNTLRTRFASSLAVIATLLLTVGGAFTVRDYTRTQPQPLIAAIDATHREASHQPQYLSKDIRDLQVMQDRVLADNPLAAETESALGEIVPAEWRV